MHISNEDFEKLLDAVSISAHPYKRYQVGEDCLIYEPLSDSVDPIVFALIVRKTVELIEVKNDS